MWEASILEYVRWELMPVIFVARKAIMSLNNQNQNQQYPTRNSSNQLHAMQARIEGPSMAQGRLEAPESQAKIHAYTKGDVKAGTSHVIIGQISIATHNVMALFHSGVTHSFVSLEFAQILDRHCGYRMKNKE
ncbi:hypothetical protein TIFTF001_016634 [Ficus carica]|uniref:Uncharacterized protein n=1 Tax=Ficus carica TaxID=3494 RepID=A0AA88A968_FICCA|nr:hypothetical protein TIFTF001_016634 [Ficus carica]